MYCFNALFPRKYLVLTFYNGIVALKQGKAANYGKHENLQTRKHVILPKTPTTPQTCKPEIILLYRQHWQVDDTLIENASFDL